MPSIYLKNQAIHLLADTHGKHRAVKMPEDVHILIHCGDVCTDGNMDEVLDFMDWFAALPIKHKVLVHGNHDLPFELEPEQSSILIPRGVHWLNDKTINLNGITIRGIGAFPHFAAGGGKEKLDIIVSHYPPHGILDNGHGFTDIRDYVAEQQPAYHVFGHNHAGYGTQKHKNTQYINASVFHEYCEVSIDASLGSE